MNVFLSYAQRAQEGQLDSRESFASFAREGRKLIGMSLRDVANQFRTAPGTVSRWENGHAAPPIIARQAIIEFFRSRVQRIGVSLESSEPPLVADPPAQVALAQGRQRTTSPHPVIAAAARGPRT
jgi:transcriptional regulator with XRE-family HTH domain